MGTRHRWNTSGNQQQVKLIKNRKQNKKNTNNRRKKNRFQNKTGNTHSHRRDPFTPPLHHCTTDVQQSCYSAEGIYFIFWSEEYKLIYDVLGTWKTKKKKIYSISNIGAGADINVI